MEMKVIQCILFFFLIGSLANKADDYDVQSIIGIGASGSVYLVKNRRNNQRYAMKKISKNYVHENNLYVQIQNERDILASNRSPYTLRLYESFYDDTYLYLITPYKAGGDLMNLIITYDIFSEDIARFYIAEILLGLEDLHRRGITSRDLKFENILIDSEGHCVLADYGLAATDFIYPDDYFKELIESDKFKNQRRLSVQVQSRPNTRRPGLGGHKRSQTMVPTLSQAAVKSKVSHQRTFRSKFGTLTYASFHLFTGKGYTSACDLWSLGIILFEATFGFPPFQGETDAQILRNLMAFKGKLEIPEFIDQNTRPTAILVDLIHKLVCFQDSASSIQEIKQHPFFQKIDWANLRHQTPPFVPDDKNDGLEYFPIQELEKEKANNLKLEVPNLHQDAAFRNFPYVNF